MVGQQYHGRRAGEADARGSTVIFGLRRPPLDGRVQQYLPPADVFEARQVEVQLLTSSVKDNQQPASALRARIHADHHAPQGIARWLLPILLLHDLAAAV